MGRALLSSEFCLSDPPGMTYPSSFDSADEAGTMPTPEFQVLILSENVQDLSRAMLVCDKLRARFKDSFMYSIAIATIAALEKAGQFQESLRLARTADMIFVVSDTPLSALSKDWLQACVRQHEDVPFVIADMTRHGTIDANALRASSVSGSRHSGVDVIREQPRWFTPNAPPSSTAPWTSRDCLNHWGINE